MGAPDADRLGRFPHRGRASPGGGERTRRSRDICSECVRSITKSTCYAADWAEYGREIYIPAAKCPIRGPGTGRLAISAEAAVLGIVDRLFSRVGASDDLARGHSTFMVEMTEAAAILHQAGPKSLVVVDEIGRGTATLDGLAIAWAILKSLHSVIRCRTIFATHFHELAELADRLPRLKPHTMRVKEWKGGVVFLHEVAEGAAKRSWGMHVAELAGVPVQVVRRAASLMAAMEKNGGPLGGLASLQALPLFAATAQPAASAPMANELALLCEALSELNPDSMSPKQALDALYHLKGLAPGCAGTARWYDQRDVNSNSLAACPRGRCFLALGRSRRPC